MRNCPRCGRGAVAASGEMESALQSSLSRGARLQLRDRLFFLAGVRRAAAAALMGASCSTAPHEIPPEEMCVRVMMHAQRTASRRNSACSQLSAFVGSNMLQGQPPPAVLAWLENPVLPLPVPQRVRRPRSASW